MIFMIAAYAKHIDIKFIEESGDLRIRLHKIVHKSQFIAIFCSMTQGGFIHTIFTGKSTHITTLKNQIYAFACNLLVVMYQLKRK